MRLRPPRNPQIYLRSGPHPPTPRGGSVRKHKITGFLNRGSPMGYPFLKWNSTDFVIMDAQIEQKRLCGAGRTRSENWDPNSRKSASEQFTATFMMHVNSPRST